MIIQRSNRVLLAAVLSIFAWTGRAPAAGAMFGGMPCIVGADQVAAALVKRGIPIQPGQVEFLVSVKSSQLKPALEIDRLQQAGDTLLARIHCRQVGECLPFYVVLHPSDRQNAGAMVERSAATATTRPVPIVSHMARPKWVVRSGQRATFVLQGKDLRATTPVICLQDGRQGESIRVSSLDGKRTLVGEIVGPGLLRGAL
jgi:hypothetical protein